MKYKTKVRESMSDDRVPNNSGQSDRKERSDPTVGGISGKERVHQICDQRADARDDDAGADVLKLKPSTPSCMAALQQQDHRRHYPR
jgi:hypothetical protein